MKRILFLLSVLICTSVYPYPFGKNKVHYKDFDWNVLSTPHFEIYFYEGEDSLARFAAQAAEVGYKKISEDFNYELSKKVPVIIYNSPNDFEQTNVIPDLIEESVGGFTEIFKNRVVIPFSGSYEDLRHVVVHELTHAFQFELLYGGGIGSMLAKPYQIQFPLWLAEGLAEFESKEWDTMVDMVMRDLTISEKIIPIHRLDEYGGSYLVYVEGESLMRFIEERYGRKKIGELLHQVKFQRSMDDALRSTIGIDLMELSKRWEQWVKKRYWPLIKDKKDVDDFARRLTDHTKDNSILNVSPRLSPDGNKIAYLSDKNGYSDLYIISAIDGKILKHLIKGERSSGFESLHIQRGGITWSPDGKKIGLIAKSQGKDLLYIIDVNTAKIEGKYEFELDGVFSPDWSPEGNKIVFVGIKDGFSDLYSFDLSTDELIRLTSDIYDDRDPAWSKDGTRLAFSSDRPNGNEEWTPGRYAIFLLNGKNIEQASFRAKSITSPTWVGSDNKICFCSDKDGVFNLWVGNISDTTYFRLSDILTGIFTPHWSRDGKKVVFSAYENIGWDLFVLKNPEQYADSIKKLSIEPIAGDTIQREEIEMSVKSYSVKFTPDWLIGGVSYNTAYGLSGETSIALSDILGNHRIYIGTDIISNIEESNFNVVYWYLPKRINYGGAIFQEKYYYFYADTLMSDKVFGAAVLLRYPFSKFHRVDLEFNAYNREHIYYERYGNVYYVAGKENRLVFLPILSLVYDTAIFGPTGPVDGHRSSIRFAKTLDILDKELSFGTVIADLRKYKKLSRRYFLAVRLVGGTTKGRDKEKFWLGGSESLRGYPNYAFSGYNFGLLNLELRHPFLDILKLAFPIPIYLRNIRGVVFCDVGSCWDNTHRLKFSEEKDGWFRLDDLKMGVGVGLRMRLTFLIVKLDFARKTDMSTISNTTIVHFSLGSDF